MCPTSNTAHQQQSLESIVPRIRNRYIFQYVAAISATTFMFAVGVAGGWNSPSIPKLIAPDSPIPMTMDQGSWLITMAVYGLLITSYPAVWLARRIGPKWTLIIATLPLFIGWLLIAVAIDVPTLFVARFFFGAAYGIVYALIPVYLSEIASDRVRGSVIAMGTVMVKCGFLFCFALAPFITIRTMAIVSMVPCLVCAGIFGLMPDSPYHLMAVGKREHAEQSLQWLRGRQDVTEDADAIELAVQEASAEKRGTWSELFSADQRRALVIGVGTSLILPLCGSTAINDYSQIIFAMIKWELSAVYASIMLAAVQLFSAVLGNVTIDLIGRRPLLLGSCAAMGVCTTVVGAYFLAEQRLQWDMSAVGWLPVVALMVFQFAFSVGLEPVSQTIMGEMFPKHLKALACAMCMMVNTSADVMVGKLFQVVSDGWGSDVAFGALALFSFVYLVFAAVKVPETKGQRLCDILENMKK